MPDARCHESAKRILSYFVRHPEAADTLEGIVRWRLLEEAIHQTTQETKEALAWLVSHGFLREIAIAPGEPIFRLNSENAGEAEAFVAQSRRAEREGD